MDVAGMARRMTKGDDMAYLKDRTETFDGEKGGVLQGELTMQTMKTRHRNHPQYESTSLREFIRQFSKPAGCKFVGKAKRIRNK
jgi:hypothetical protein